MCAAEASSELIKQCLAHELFRAAFERVKRDKGERQRQQCCLIDLSRAVRAAVASRSVDALLRVLTETNSLYAPPPTRPPFVDADATLDAREAAIAAQLLLVIRLDDDLHRWVIPCVHLLRTLKPARRVFIDMAALPEIICIYGDTISAFLRPWTAGAGIVAEWLPYLAQPLMPPGEAAAPVPAKWSSIYIDVSECTAEMKWEVLEHLLLLRDLNRLHLENGAPCVIRWFSRGSGQDPLYLNFSHFLHGVIKAFGRAHISYPALRFLCLARAWCQVRDNAITDALKFMPLLALGASEGDWVVSSGAHGDSRRFSVFPDALQSILIRGYVAVIYPQQRLRESSEALYSLHASGGATASPRKSGVSAYGSGIAAAPIPRPLPPRGIVQPMHYLEAVRGPAGSGKHPAYAEWQLAAHEAVWHVQVQLMARGYLRIPQAQLPPPPTPESIRALNIREIEIQSNRERTGRLLEDV